MKIEKIDIQTSNKKHATDIAMLVDKPEFLKELITLREKWGVIELYPLSAIHEELIPKGALKDRVEEFDSDIEGLLRKFHRGKNFKKVINYALLTGIVPEGIYQSCYFDVVTIGEKEDLSKPEQYQYVIVMSPRTEKQEVERAYKEFQEFVKGREATNEFESSVLGKINFQNSNLDAEIPEQRDLIEQFHKGAIYTSVDISKFKTQKELERTREWYWIRYQDYFNNTGGKPLSYPEVLKKWQKNCKINGTRKVKDWEYCTCPYCSFNDINIIEQALASYNKLLTLS